MQITGAELNCSDVARTEAFYTGKLGLPVLARSADSITYKFGWSELTFHQNTKTFHVPQHFAFNIPHRQLPVAKLWLKQRVPLLTGPDGGDQFEFPAWNAEAIYFRDMDENIVELIARDGFLPNVYGAFDIRQIACLSEVGIVTDHVDTLASEISERCKVQKYRDGTTQFCPLGNKAGLLILVETGRLWFPDFQTMAAPYPVTVRLQDEFLQKYTFKLGVENGSFVHTTHNTPFVV